MDFGVFLPISGRAAGAETLTDAARTAEAVGFGAVWSADRVVTPWEIHTPYPYGAEGTFIVPPDRPFLDSMSCLAFLAARTERIRLGISVLVLPYRHPLYWARLAVSIDHLSGGRLVMGVGVGWMEEEFEALGIPYRERGRMTDEQLEIVERLWRDERVEFNGEFYSFRGLAFHPKPARKLPIWVGGEGAAARRRSARHGDAWFPYFVRISADELRAGYEDVRRHAAALGRDPDAVALTCCRPIEVTRDPVEQDDCVLRGTPEQLVAALGAYQAAGVSHLALQFMLPRWPERLEQIERFGCEVIPALA
jgi:probable F420-dependent oxidoreductase